MVSAIVVDYEELRRLAAVWRSAAQSLAQQAFAVGALAADPSIFVDAVFDPLGAAAVERAILAAAGGPHGIGGLSVKFAFDALALDAVVAKEQLADDFPLHQLEEVGRWLLTVPVDVLLAPRKTLRAGGHDLNALGNAVLGYVSPFTEPLLALLAPSARFRADVLAGRPLRVDPVLGLPLAAVDALAPEGPGYVSISRYRPAWAGTPAGSLGSVMHRVADLEHAPDASLAVERVVGPDGVSRYVVELPGMRHMGASSDPQDLTGSITAVVAHSTAYTRCVTEALDAAGVARGADVMLIGHSEGGIVAMDLAGDPSFNGGRVTVTHVVAAGSPISSKQVVAGSATKVFSVEDVNDIVTHLDAADSAVETPDRLTYQFSADYHDVIATHDPDRYAERIDGLDDSPNPLFQQFRAGVAPYLSGETSTFVFKLADAAPK